LRKRILDELADGKLSAAESLGFVNDEFALALAGVSRIEDFLNTVLVCRHQSNYVVWSDIISHLAYLDQLLAFEPAWSSFAGFIGDVCREAFDRLGWKVSEGEDHQERLLRSLLLGALGRSQDLLVLTRCEEMFQGFLKNPDSLHPDLRIGVFRTVIGGGRLGDAFEILRERALSEPHQEEKMRFLTGLASSRKAEEIRLLLEDSLSDRIRSQDTVSVVTSVAGNPYGREQAWSFFTERFQEFSRRYSSGGFALSRLIRSMGDNRKDPEFAQRLEEFFLKNPLTGGQRAIRQTLESIDFNRAVWAGQGAGLSKKLLSMFPAE
jgi:puromycin-sensitive aminopeptidase